MIENVGAYSQQDYDRGYKQGEKDAYKKMFTEMKDLWEFYEKNKANCPMPTFISALAMLEMFSLAKEQKNE